MNRPRKIITKDSILASSAHSKSNGHGLKMEIIM